MGNTVTLKHAVHTLPERLEPFYDGGHLTAIDGLLTLPVEDDIHIRAAYFRGYNKTPEGQRLETIEQLIEFVENQTAKSAKENYESDDTGGQPAPENRVRTSQSDSSKKVSRRRLGSSQRSRADDGATEA